MVPDRAEGVLIDRAATAPFVDIETLSPPGGLLVLVPHPDDETLGCGETLAAAAEGGRRIGIVQLTDGEGSHPHSRSHPREVLIALRGREFDEALDALTNGGAVERLRLGLPDGRTTIDEATAPETVARVASFGREIEARAIWTTWDHDPHCDHEAAAACARAVADELGGLPVWSYAVWGRFGPHGRHAASPCLFASAAYAGRKRRAIAAHRSQLTPLIKDDPSAFTMPPALVKHFATHPEIFIPSGEAPDGRR